MLTKYGSLQLGIMSFFLITWDPIISSIMHVFEVQFEANSSNVLI